MADPVKQLCDELDVCREEAIYYLEGFEWDLNSAMEARRINNLPLPSLTEESSPDTRIQLVESFMGATFVTSVDVAIKYLSRYNWDLKLAGRNFWEDRSPLMKLNSQKPLRIGQSNSKDDRTTTKTWQLHGKTGTSSPMEVGAVISFPQEQESLLHLIPDAIPLMESSSQMKKEEVWIDTICDETGGVSREEAMFYLEAFKWKYNAAKEACRNKTLPPVEETSVAVSNQREEEPSQFNNELIKQFLDFTHQTVPRNQAIACLKRYNWNLEDAVKNFWQSDLPNFTEEEQIAQALELNWIENNRALLQVDEKKELFDVPIATEEDNIVVGPRGGRIITKRDLKILMDIDGSLTEAWIPVRPDQTVRDIRNDIEDLIPHDNVDYYLRSNTGVEYKDLDTTVDSILSDGCTELTQVFPNM